jgi:hypothetical protein
MALARMSRKHRDCAFGLQHPRTNRIRRPQRGDGAHQGVVANVA